MTRSQRTPGWRRPKRVKPALCYDCGRAEGGDVVFVGCDNTAGHICNDCAAAAFAEDVEDGALTADEERQFENAERDYLNPPGGV